MKTLHSHNVLDEQETKTNKKRKEETIKLNSSSGSEYDDLSGTDTSSDSSNDVTMDSASNNNHDKSMDKGMADTADESAPLPLARGG